MRVKAHAQQKVHEHGYNITNERTHKLNYTLVKEYNVHL